MTETDSSLPAPPHDNAAERAVLGACLYSADAHAAALALLADDDWYRPAHLELWKLMRAVAVSGAKADPVAVNAALATASAKVKRLVDSQLLIDLYRGVGVAANVEHYCRLVADAGLRRRIVTAAQGAIQRAHELPEAADAAEWAVTEMQLARDTQSLDGPTDVDVHELIAERSTLEWVIPGLLAKTDRLILTASEGLGKSTMLRQIAVMAAAGLDPFTTGEIEPRRVLVVDCENSRGLSRDRYRPLVLKADQYKRPVEDRLRLDIRPSGLNLVLSTDAALLLRMVERVQPDLLLIGPIYRLHEGDPNDERDARKIAAVLDRARAASGCAVITEAHTPHSDGNAGHLLRPYGSSLWKRWPEFGYCLKLTAESDLSARLCRLVPWRGPRDERDWPDGMCAGGEWPWSPVSRESMRFAS